jgi:hypothetical protein
MFQRTFLSTSHLCMSSNLRITSFRLSHFSYALSTHFLIPQEVGGYVGLSDTACSRLFPPVPACSRLLPPVPACSRLCAPVPACYRVFPPVGAGAGVLGVRVVPGGGAWVLCRRVVAACCACVLCLRVVPACIFYFFVFRSFCRTIPTRYAQELSLGIFSCSVAVQSRSQKWRPITQPRERAKTMDSTRTPARS